MATLRTKIFAPTSMPPILSRVANYICAVSSNITLITLRPIISLHNIHASASNRNSRSMAVVNNVVHFYLGI